MLKKILAVSLLLCLICASASAAIYDCGDGRNVLLAIGGSFAYARDTEGNLRVWGDNQFGQLGKGNQKQSFQISDFKTKNQNIDLAQIKDIIPASDYSFLWMEDGTVYGVGNNSYMPLTVAEGTYSTHVRTALPETPVAMATGFGHAMMLTENGEVYAWGIDATGTEGQTMTAYYGWNNGGGYVDADGNYIINCEGNVGAYEWAKKLYDNGWTNKSPVTELRDDMQKLVAGDKMAMLITANFFPSLYPDCELLMGEVPYNDEVQDKAISMAVQDALIFFNNNAKAVKDTPEKLAAIQKFVDYIYAAEQYLPMCIQEGLLPATASGIDLLVKQDPSQAAYVSILENAQFYARAKSNWSDCSTGLCDAAGKIFSGQMSVKDALDEVQAVCEEG